MPAPQPQRPDPALKGAGPAAPTNRPSAQGCRPRSRCTVHTLQAELLDNGTPLERAVRKATGLRPHRG